MGYCVRSMSYAIAISAGLVWSADAAEPTPPNPHCTHAFGMCSYVDANGKELTSAQFERALPFAEHLAVVRVDGKYGYVDEKGAIVIAPKFKLAGAFYHGLAPIVDGNKVGVIDRTGAIVMAPAYASAIPFAKDAVLVREGEWRSSYVEGSELLASLADPLSLIRSGGTWSIVGIDGRVRLAGLAEISAFEKEGRGLVWAKAGSGQEERYGLVNALGKWVVPPAYDHVQWLMDGRAVVHVREGKATKWGLVDETGKVVVAPSYDFLGYVDHGYAVFKMAGKSGLIDKNGEVVVAALYDDLGRPDERGVIRAVLDGKTIYLNAKGDVIDSLATVGQPRCPDGRQLWSNEGRFALMRSDNEPAFTLHSSADFACSAPLLEKLPSGKFHYTDAAGKEKFAGIFDAATDFYDGIALVRAGSHWGIIDDTGASVIPMNETRCRSGVTGLGQPVLYLPRHWIKLERSYAEALARDMAELEQCTGSSVVCAGACPKEKDGKWGYAGDDRAFIIAPKYDFAAPFSNGRAWVADPVRREWCQIKADGTRDDAVACKCGQPLIIYEFNNPAYNRGITDCYEGGLYNVRKDFN